MKKSILGLEGVVVLSKQQQKNVNGGGYVANPRCTGNTMVIGESTVVNECQYQYQRTFLGFNYGKLVDLAPANAYGPCPVGMQC